MYSTCPKCGHERQPGDGAGADQCPACGIFYAKWLKQSLSNGAGTSTEYGTRSKPGTAPAGYLLAVEETVNPFYFWGRVSAFLVLLAWGWHFIRLDFITDPYAIGRSFMHNINLVFHEAGHVVFQPFGWFMTILGGTLGQLLMPLTVAGVFLVRQRNPFAATVGVWWLGQSSIDCAPYIDDALEQKLVLLGGHTGADAPGNHDWNNILGDLNMLEKHRVLAQVFDTAGTCLILLALVWGGILLYRQFRNLDTIR